LLNNILAKIQANLAGVADAIMLDLEGFVSETNATNLFMVNEEGVLLTPHADHCLPGVTRQTVLDLAKELAIPWDVRRISLAEFHAASEGKNKEELVNVPKGALTWLVYLMQQPFSVHNRDNGCVDSGDHD
jgi:branched-subunit amino acid aminotransferase/4-amino-4-deoxychorismate lyase